MGTGCVDAAEQTGEGLVGTWPTRWPRWLGPQIDHVLVTGGITAETLACTRCPAATTAPCSPACGCRPDLWDLLAS